ncbi:MAG: thiamine phosphate synthase [Candidatus Binatia bacterium]
MPLALAPFYAILDPQQTRGRAPEWVLRRLLDGGAKILQLRVKAMAPRDFWALAREARAQTRAAGCQLIVNDRVDIALACDADGVHLGQEDLPLGAGKKLMGRKIVGISTHDVGQAREAEQNGADYIGFGPMFGTTTKDTGLSARGVEMLKQIRAAVKIPIVAIGGITEQNVQQVWQAGADSAAIIGDVLGAQDIAGKVARISLAR